MQHRVSYQRQALIYIHKNLTASGHSTGTMQTEGGSRRWCGLIEFLPTEGLGYYHLRGLSTPILSWFCEAAMSLSDWILVVFSWERLLIIVSPFRFGFLQRVLAARLIIVVLVILSLACYAFRFVKGYIFETVHDYHVLQSVYGWHFIWERVDNTALVVVKILTFLLILVPNVILIAFLVRQQRSSIGEMRRNQQAHSGASTSTSASKSLSQHGINIILLSSALLYLITRTPKFFDLCARAIPPRYYWNFSYMDDDSIHTLVKPVIMVSTYCGYSLNFYIYLLTERQYRRRFVELVARPACHPCFPTMFANGDDEQRTGDREMNERHPANTINSAIHSSDS
ncbi:uncharacterized protein LOC129588824 isoform X2 [Paramacrobiotus metropolitanus]|uniref:uncharacterized protein LOC129588824 isoform X2 n=1 Tax=Paramacrobiotus metropolitanus TaxID=2943436 RepID=UPI0024459DFC|nr:uncharacterized protein LOC129588824 isoform X2 [Paramacrobiotus metropolitanus]